MTLLARGCTFSRGMTDIKQWDAGGAELGVLHEALTELPAYADSDTSDLMPMRAKGLVHAHVRIRGTKTILRIPRIGAFDLEPEENLDYQATAFERAAGSGHVPRLHGRIAPRDGIPWGALVISEITGQTPPLPKSLSALARALAALHALPVPVPWMRRPLLSHDDPVAATLAVIEDQARFVADAIPSLDARRQIAEELDHARSFAADVAGRDIPLTLVGTDTHPGNFIMQPDGEAVFVDLEKMLYGAPAIDLAHATVYTSTMWDADIATALSADDIAAFYDTYFEAMPATLGASIRPWCGPMRRLTWLRTMTWCARWRVDSRNGAAWSAAQHDPAYISAVRRRVDDYFDPETIFRLRTGFENFS